MLSYYFALSTTRFGFKVLLKNDAQKYKKLLVKLILYKILQIMKKKIKKKQIKQ